MARLPRLVVPLQPHYLVQRSVDELTAFRDDADYRAFLGWLREAGKQFQLAVHAYALLPDQVHLLVTPSDGTGLSRAMQWIGRHYVPHFNQKYQRAGTLWQGRFKAVVLEPEPYLLACSQHIEALPVRSELAIEPGAYPWSSWRHHVGVAADPSLVDHVLFWKLGNTPFDREAEYRRRYEEGEGKLFAGQLAQAVETGWPLGSDAFKEMVAQRSGRRSVPGRRGRPRIRQVEPGEPSDPPPMSTS